MIQKNQLLTSIITILIAVAISTTITTTLINKSTQSEQPFQQRIGGAAETAVRQEPSDAATLQPPEIPQIEAGDQFICRIKSSVNCPSGEISRSACNLEGCIFRKTIEESIGFCSPLTCARYDKEATCKAPCEWTTNTFTPTK